MFFRITSDVDASSGVGEITDDLSGPARNYFQEKSYGDDLLGIGVILMCRSDAVSFKRRVRFVKADKRLYVDVMLSVETMKKLSPEQRLSQITSRIAVEIPETILKYKLSSFDLESFSRDLTSWCTTAAQK